MNRRIFTLSLLAAVPYVAFAKPQSSSQLRINGERLNSRLTELAEFGKTPEGGTNRPAYTDADLQARDYVMKLMRETKLEVNVDAAGNIVGRRNGSETSLK